MLSDRAETSFSKRGAISATKNPFSLSFHTASARSRRSLQVQTRTGVILAARFLGVKNGYAQFAANFPDPDPFERQNVDSVDLSTFGAVIMMGGLPKPQFLCLVRYRGLLVRHS